MPRKPARKRSNRRAPFQGASFAMIPAYFWAVLLYVAVVFGATMVGSAPGGSQGVAAYLDTPLFKLPMVAGDGVSVSWTVLFALIAFVCSWVEAIRALALRGKALNDIGSILTTLPMIVLLVGFEKFQTPAFLILVVVAIGDVILDRIVHRTVSYRDFYSA